MVRVGGGWDTLSHYLDKHDPCRCKTGMNSVTVGKEILNYYGDWNKRVRLNDTLLSKV